MSAIGFVVSPSPTATDSPSAVPVPAPTSSETPTEQATATQAPTSTTSETSAATQVVQVDPAQYDELMLSFQVMGMVTCLILFFVVVLAVLQIGGKR